MAIFRFSKWRPSAILELFYHHTRPPTKSLLLAAADCQILCQFDKSQVNDILRTQTGHSLYVRITLNILHITSILFHVKLRSASGSDQAWSAV